MIDLGQKVRDTITGFAGVVTARAVWLTGCDRYYVTSTTLYEGKVVEDWFDENRLENVPDKPVTVQVADENPGGPQPDPGSRKRSSINNHPIRTMI